MTITQVNAEIARLGHRVSTLKGLNDVESQTAPLSDTVVDYYQDNIAQGGGPNGTWLLSDFFGTAAGVPYNQSLDVVNELIEQGTDLGYFSTLSEAYSRMYLVVTDVYGAPPTITIPSGPGAGSYSDYDSALIALVAAADAAIGALITLYPDYVDQLNAAWQPMETAQPNTLTAKFAKAGVVWSDLQTAQLPITAFISSIGSLGNDTEQGQSAQIFEGLADTSNAYGQALIGAMREGRNTAGITDIGLGIDNSVPSVPASVPPQAPLTDGVYTVSQARNRLSNLYS